MEEEGVLEQGGLNVKKIRAVSCLCVSFKKKRRGMDAADMKWAEAPALRKLKNALSGQAGKANKSEETEAEAEADADADAAAL